MKPISDSMHDLLYGRHHRQNEFRLSFTLSKTLYQMNREKKSNRFCVVFVFILTGEMAANNIRQQEIHNMHK